MAFGIPSGVRLGIDYGQWKQRSEGLAAEARKKQQKIQQLYDSIREYERRTTSFGNNPLPVDLFQNLRNSIQQYENLSGEQYDGFGRELAGLMPFRGRPRISSGYSTSGRSSPSAASQARQQERAAIRSQKQQEGQELKDAQWLANYETKRAELQRRATSTGVSPQENYNAQQELIKLELERQRRETRMPGYETPEKRTQREKREAETAKMTRTAEREQRIQSANQQLDRLIAALDQTTEAGAIAQINKLRPQLDKGASPESIIRQAQAAYTSAEELREKKRKETMEDWKIKFDYGKGKSEELQRNAQRFQVMMQNARMLESRSSVDQKELGDLEKDLLNAQAELAKWEGALAVMPEVVEGKPDPLQKERGDLTRYIAGLKQTIQVIDEAISSWKPRSQTGGGMLPVPSEYSQSNPAQPQTQADFDALPSGSYYINPANGAVYKKN